MASFEEVRQRALLSAGLSSYMRSEDGHHLYTEAQNPSTGEVVVVPALPEESAIVTFHRLEQSKSSPLVLVTRLDDRPVAIILAATSVLTDKQLTKDLVGGTTTADWVRDMMSAGKDLHYTARGTEFQGELQFTATSKLELLPA